MSGGRVEAGDGACVPGGRLLQYYPWMYAPDCFWKPDWKFAGWSAYGLPDDSSPYYSVLIARFECYDLVWPGVCASLGARRRAPS